MHSSPLEERALQLAQQVFSERTTVDGGGAKSTVGRYFISNFVYAKKTIYLLLSHFAVFFNVEPEFHAL